MKFRIVRFHYSELESNSQNETGVKVETARLACIFFWNVNHKSRKWAIFVSTILTTGVAKFIFWIDFWPSMLKKATKPHCSHSTQNLQFEAYSRVLFTKLPLWVNFRERLNLVCFWILCIECRTFKLWTLRFENTNFELGIQ